MSCVLRASAPMLLLASILCMLLAPSQATFQIRSQSNPSLCVVPFTAEKPAKSFLSPLVLRLCPKNNTVKGFASFSWNQDGDKIRHAQTNLFVKVLAGVQDNGVNAELGSQEAIPVLWGYGVKAPYNTQYSGTPMTLNTDATLQLKIASSGSPKYCLQPAGGAALANNVLLAASTSCDATGQGIKLKFWFRDVV